jgi:hypothetical protein
MPVTQANGQAQRKPPEELLQLLLAAVSADGPLAAKSEISLWVFSLRQIGQEVSVV